MIQKVSFRNFKAYRSLDLELEPFTVVVGPNASGKTTLLRGLEFISSPGSDSTAIVKREIKTRGPPGARAYGSNAPIEVSIEGAWDGTTGSLRAVNSENDDGFGFIFTGDWGGRLLEPGDIFLSSDPLFNPTLDVFREALSSTKVLRFEPRRLAEASYSEEAIPTVSSDGSGLASVLAHLKLSSEEAFVQIELALKQVAPAVRRIRIERASVERTAIRTLSLDAQRHDIPETRTLWGQKIVLDMKGAKGVPADSAGEGTLMALGLLTVLMGPNQPRLVLLDDIELGLHPVAQGRLIEVLRKIQQNEPRLQIIATSHSPFILNYLDPKEVRMTFLAENGFARCEKLTAHPEFERWKDMMSPGEFWSTVGESWVEKMSKTADHE